jgi:hypothetical protein|tara:strand:+ start:258 stop:500 length:243 start_codon:yes stop_codon:yes gene_type:complete
MNLKLIEKQIETIDEVLFALKKSESNLKCIRNNCNSKIYKLILNEDKIKKQIADAENSVDIHKHKYLKEVDNLIELNKYI